MQALRSTGKVYCFMRDYQILHGYPPRLDEIAAGVKLGKTAVHNAVSQLVAMGAVIRRPRSPRGALIPGVGDDCASDSGRQPDVQ
jgi:DNA-binding GntR family transcriptional regulator